MKSPVLTDLIHNHTSIIETISGEITSSDRPGTHYTYQNYTDHIWWNHQFWPTIIHIRIIQNISGEITSSDWPDTQSYINYRDLIWWNHQFWPTWYTLYISELYRPYLVKSPGACISKLSLWHSVQVCNESLTIKNPFTNEPPTTVSGSYRYLIVRYSLGNTLTSV